MYYLNKSKTKWKSEVPEYGVWKTRCGSEVERKILWWQDGKAAIKYNSEILLVFPSENLDPPKPEKKEIDFLLRLLAMWHGGGNSALYQLLSYGVFVPENYSMYCMEWKEWVESNHREKYELEKIISIISKKIIYDLLN